MSSAPPPKKSPLPDYVPPGDTPTGRWKIQLEKKVKVGSIVVGLTLIATIGGGILAVQGEARAEAKKTVTTELADDRAQAVVVKQRLELLERAQLAQADVNREQASATRDVNLKLDALLKDRRIPNPAPTPPADGGPP